MTNIKRIGFIGLGTMGGGMARNLIKANYNLNVYDIDQSKIKALVSSGAILMTSLKEVSEKSDVIFSSLPDPFSVRKAYLGPEGIIEGALPETILVDMSTVDPETSRSLHNVASKKNVKYLDAPVSGGPKEAETGKLVIIVGGDKNVFERIKPILNLLGSTIHYAGLSGAGNVVKLVNNIMSMGNILIAAEAFTLGVKAGVDGQMLFNIIRTSGGRSHHLEKRFPNVLVRNFEPGFTVDLAKKDLSLALDMAKNLTVPLPATSLIHQLYSAISSLGDGEKDCVAIIRLFESWAGVEVHG